MSGLIPYIIRRLLWLPVVILVVSFITFMLGRYGPGDPVEMRAGPRASPEAVAQLRKELGLDKPVIIQYADYMGGLFRGDLGESIRYPGISAKEMILPRMAVSAQLGAVALFAAFFVGMTVGVTAAYFAGKLADRFLIGFFLLFQSLPSLLSIPLLLLFFVVKLHWLPAAGWEGIFSRNIIIPALALSLPGVAGVARLMRANILGVLGEDYVRTARAKGLPEFTVITRHVVRNAMLPMVTIIGLSLVGILEGAFFTELLYGIPGVGRLALDSVFSRDYDIIMSLTLIIGFAFILAQILTDITYAFIDPRIRLDKKND